MFSGIFLNTSILHITIYNLTVCTVLCPNFYPPGTVQPVFPWVVRKAHATVLLSAVYYSREGIGHKSSNLLCLSAYLQTQLRFGCPFEHRGCRYCGEEQPGGEGPLKVWLCFTPHCLPRVFVTWSWRRLGWAEAPSSQSLYCHLVALEVSAPCRSTSRG